MRALGDPEPAKVIGEIDAFEASGRLSAATAQGMLWARLRSIERLADPNALVDYFSRLASQPLEDWQLDQIYPAIAGIDDLNRRLNALQALLQSTIPDVRMAQRFEMLEIDTLSELGQFENAYASAKRFRDAYPKLADAYRLFALAATKTDRPFEADRAWRAITERTDPRRDVWWEGMLQRVEIRATSTRPESRCEVLSEIELRTEFMPTKFQPEVERILGRFACESETIDNAAAPATAS